MTVSVESIQQIGVGSWRVLWSSTIQDPTFYIWRDGQLMDVTTAEEYIFQVPAGEQLNLEVYDDESQKPVSAFPGKVVIGWYSVANTSRYIVQEYVGGEWLTRKTVNHTSAGYYSWESRFLEDSTSHQFRVVPQGVNGNAGAALTFEVFIVRFPDIPPQIFSYSEVDNTVTVG